MEEASNGETALSLAMEKNYDLIFIDQYMSSTEKTLLGTETTRELRSKGVTSAICGLSANDLEDTFIAEGANAFIMKPLPCDKDKLCCELIRILHNYQGEDDGEEDMAIYKLKEILPGIDTEKVGRDHTGQTHQHAA